MLGSNNAEDASGKLMSARGGWFQKGAVAPFRAAMMRPSDKKIERKMATYKSKETKVNAPAERVYAKLSNLENLQDVISNLPEEKIPADKIDMLKQIEITPTTISFPAGPVGKISLEVSKLTPPKRIELSGVGTPVKLDLGVDITEKGAEESEVQVWLDIDIPMMLKPMIGGTLQSMVDQFATVMTAIKF